MTPKFKIILLLLTISTLSITSCKKDDDLPTPSPTSTASKSFLNLTFNTTTAYFSTDGSMSSPVDSNQAKTITSKIDITFIFNYDYTKPGFFDPIARSQVWYWNDYYKPWLSTAVKTEYYKTSLTKADFDAAKTDQSKIATCFSNSSTVLAPHGIFPTGSCIGGRQSSNPLSIMLSQGNVFGFKNTTSGKRGLIYIRMDQYSGWPMPISNFNTKVDIIREN